MSKRLLPFLRKELSNLQDAGLVKAELVLDTAQGREVGLPSNRRLLNLASNNYLGLANHPKVTKAAKEAVEKFGMGLASPRVITAQSIHRDLEKKLAEFLGTEESILFSSGYHANVGVFESLLSDQDTILYDTFCHPSLLEGIELSKAKRVPYRRNNIMDLEDKLKRSPKARFRVIVTDGVFPLDGIVANLKEICELARKYDALVMVDDSQGVGVVGERGRGSAEYHQVIGEVDLLMGTFGNALGSSGGYLVGHREMIQWLKQRSRPYLFSTALSPACAAAAYEGISLIQQDQSVLEKLRANVSFFRQELSRLGFRVVKGDHPIIPIIVNDAVLAQKLADRMYQKGIYVIGFCYPVVPKGFARIRIQVSADHTMQDLKFALDTLAQESQALGLLKE